MITIYFFNSMTNIRNFDPNLVNVNETSFEKNTVLFMRLNISKILIFSLSYF